jgi:Ca2+-binding RTX toxin-like protein
MAISSLDLAAVNGSSLDPFDPNNSTLFINENVASGTIVAKIVGFAAGENPSQLVFTPSGSKGDDLGHYEIVQATSNGPNNGSGPEWVVGDWVVRVKNGGPVEFNYEDIDGPTDGATHEVTFTVTGKNGWVPKATYTANFQFLLSDANDAPSDITFGPVQPVQAGMGANVNVVKATWYDEDDPFANPDFADNMYRFSNGTLVSGEYKIDPSTGQISTNEQIDTSGQVSLIVEAYDPDQPTLKVTKTVIFNVAGAPAPTLSISATSASKAEGNSGQTPFTFTVTRSGSDLTSDSTVNWALSGIGIDPSDFSGPTSGQVTFLSGQTTKTITVFVNGDTVVEPDEGFTVTLSSPSNATITTASASSTITNDDAPPAAPTVSIAAQDAVKNEGDSSTTAFTFTVTRTGDTSDISTVDWIFSGSGIIDPAETDDVAGQTSGQVVFAKNQTSATITVFINGDTAVEGHEDFTVTLTNPQKATIGTASASGTINNDDVAGNPVAWTITPKDASKLEGNAGTTDFVFTVTRSSASGPATITWTAQGTGNKAASGADFAGMTGTINFPDGVASINIVVPVIGDSIAEGNEDFSVTLSNPSTGTITVPSANGVILDDENDAPTNIVLAGSSVMELSGTGAVVGTLSAQDPDDQAGFTYTLLDNAGGRFRLNGSQLLVDNGFALDFEQAASHVVKVRVSDSSGATYDKSLTISVTDWMGEFTTGTPLADIFKGGVGNDTLSGGSSSDKLYGGIGNDKLSGGTGNDYLWGGDGKDTLTGNAGKDFFVFDSFNAKTNKKTNVDAIKDFKVKDDTIYLDNAVFKALGKAGTELKPAKMKKDAFVIGSKAQDKNDRIIYDNKKGILYYDADGTGAKAAVQIATISKKLLMTEKDFFII